MKPVLLIGSQGQVGTELKNILSSTYQLTSISRQEIDLKQPEKLRTIIRDIEPEIIINAAAYTAVDKAESEAEIAHTINAITPQIIAEETEKIGSFLIHISTDYVFNGQSNYPYQESDITNPLNIYGKTKLEGEKAIEQTCKNHIILRTAWVYGTYGKSNFVKTMLRIGKERSEIRVVADQIGTPTWSKDIATTISQIIPQLTSEIAGIYHYTNSGVASWYDFAINIFQEAKKLGFPLRIDKIIPITTPEYPTPAKRPAYSVLCCDKISKLLGTYPPHWQQRLQLMLTELHNN
ncbi:dTDP-4-dehydrorhamnose reductase [Anabaena sp. FACHB-1237]|uniref:dTDP-4-dehydrorhamnose reductase n=1 Tax=Anabaena sp. FACHB-1237 TaxID=2692769 RepID=UPI001681055D|nr:dTDP-4-dehydrorhamnose reductase [Anabaena sp. FACHB-1237]MBD2139551.1 dTDP-4-dehydrorhamnose reductase [Anabaena sp. FACHB-1237]